MILRVTKKEINENHDKAFLVFFLVKLLWLKISLVFFSFFTLAFQRVHTNFFVILLQSSQIFTSFRELSFFHTFSYIPMDKSTFGVHQIKLVIQTGPGFSNGSCIGQHTNSTGYFGQVTSGYNGGGLVVDTNFETSRAPINKLNGAFGLDGSNGSVDILGDNIASVEHAAGHVLAVTGIAFDHLVGRFEASIGNFSNGQLLMVGLFS